jgi:hypothetical protein
MYKCKFCHTDYKTNRARTYHQHTCIEALSIPNTRYRQCTECVEIVHVKQLRQHFKINHVGVTPNLFTCAFCNKNDFDSWGMYKQHERKCELNTNSHINNIICPHCTNEYKHLISHIDFCSKNPLKQYTTAFTSRMQTAREQTGFTNITTKARLLGLPIPEISDETRQKISDASSKRVWSDDEKKQHSVKMKQVVLDNPDSYNSGNRGNNTQITKYGIKFHSPWELSFYEYCLTNSILIERGNESFSYIWNGNTHLYFPDFKLPTLNMYVEVKGYETDRDHAKWKYFPHKLLIIRQASITQIQKNTFDLFEFINGIIV